MVGNLLGATGLLVNDAVAEQIAGAQRRSSSAIAALTAMHYFGPTTVTQIGRLLHVTQPAATRLLQALETDGLCRRADQPGKSVPVELTPQGAEVVSEALGRRARVLDGMLDSLEPAEITQLGLLLDKLLTAGFARCPDERYLCRLCARDKCGDAQSRCPIGRAADAHVG